MGAHGNGVRLVVVDAITGVASAASHCLLLCDALHDERVLPTGGTSTSAHLAPLTSPLRKGFLHHPRLRRCFGDASLECLLDRAHARRRCPSAGLSFAVSLQELLLSRSAQAP